MGWDEKYKNTVVVNVLKLKKLYTFRNARG